MTKFDVTFLTRQKHTALYEVAKRLGGQSELARELSLSPSEVGDWVNFKAYPSLWESDYGHGKAGRWRDAAFRDSIEKKLTELCGKTIDDLWPEELRTAIRNRGIPSIVESVKSFDIKRLPFSEAKYLALPPPEDERIAQETENAVESELASALKSLSYRERHVVMLRFGIPDGETYTQEEVGHIFKVTKERIAQIERKALRKLSSRLGQSLREHLPELVEDRDLSKYDNRREVSLKEKYAASGT